MSSKSTPNANANTNNSRIPIRPRLKLGSNQLSKSFSSSSTKEENAGGNGSDKPHSTLSSPSPVNESISDPPNIRNKLQKLVPVHYKCNLERPTHDFYELPRDITDLPLEVKLDKPVAFYDPTDVSFVDEPISKDDLDAALVGMIPPVSKPPTPRKCIQHSSSVYQKKPIQTQREKVQGQGSKKRKNSNPPTPSKIPVRRKVDPPTPQAIIQSMSKHSLLDDTKAPSDLNQSDDVSLISDRSAISTLTQDCTFPSTEKKMKEEEDLCCVIPPNYRGEESISSHGEGEGPESVFVYFPESEDEIREKDPNEILQSCEDSSKRIVVKRPGENGDGPHMTKKNTKSCEDDLKTMEREIFITEIYTDDSTIGSQSEKEEERVDEKIPIAKSKDIRTQIREVLRDKEPEVKNTKEAKVQMDARKPILKREARIQINPFEEATIQTGSSINYLTNHHNFGKRIQGQSEEYLGKSECRLILPQPSTLILRRMDEPDLTPTSSPLNLSGSGNVLGETTSSSSFGERRFTAKFAVHNPTSDIYGFKIYCNYTALTHITITPKQGLLQPFDRISIRIRTKKTKKLNVTNDRLSDAKLLVKYFQSSCEDPSKIGEYLEQLSIENPDLIKTERIEKVILLDSGDLLSTTRLLDTFRKLSEEISEDAEGIFQNEEDETGGLLNILMDETQRNALKNSIYKDYASNVLPKVRDHSKLHSLQMEMFITNQTLRKYVSRLGRIEDLVHATIFFTIFFLMYAYILPFFNTNLVVENEREIDAIDLNMKTPEEIYEDLPIYGKVLYSMEKWIGLNIFSI